MGQRQQSRVLSGPADTWTEGSRQVGSNPEAGILCRFVRETTGCSSASSQGSPSPSRSLLKPQVLGTWLSLAVENQGQDDSYWGRAHYFHKSMMQMNLHQFLESIYRCICHQ